MVERRLGRGLDFFLSRTEKAEKKDAPAAEVAELDVSALEANPFQPRTEFDEVALGELAESIRANGVIQPIVVRRAGQTFQIVAGERRWRAAKLAGLARVPVVVRDVPDATAAVLALVENVQRSDLNPIEKARAFRRLAELTGDRLDDIGKQLGLDRSTVSNFVRLLDLSAGVQALVSRGTLSMGHARALLGLSELEQQTLAEVAVRDRLSVREIEARAQGLKTGGVAKDDAVRSAGGKKGRPAWLHEIEDTLQEVLGTSVQVRYGRKRSTITIDCRGRAEFERVYELLKTVEGELGGNNR